MPEEQGLEKYKNRLRIILSEGQENGTKIKRLKSLAHDLVDNSKNMDRENRKYMLFLAEECVEEIEKLQKKEENSIVKKDVKANQHTGDLLQNNDAKEFVKKLNPAIFQTDFDHIAGLDDVKRIIINQVIKAGENPDIAKMYGIMGRNILLFGPPGTGKTSIAQAISNKTQFPMVTITPSYILDNKFGEFEKNIKSLFTGAELIKPIIIFFDEFESLAPRRTSINSSYMKRAVPEMLRQMTDMRKKSDGGIILIGATNNPWDIDDAMLNPERFDTKIYVPPPDDLARASLFRIFLSELKASGEINYEELGRLSEGFTGADIKYICRNAAENVFSDVIEKHEVRDITQIDVVNAMERAPKSITMDLLGKYDKFRDKFHI